jgi:DNA-binding MarR family transcriptional regulator
MPAEDAYRERLQAAKRASLSQVLFKCARFLNEQALSRVRARSGAPQLRPSHTALFPHVALAGTRLTELAERLGVTKQAVGHLVEDLEGMGVLERIPDPSDGRAKLVRFTARGRRGLLHGLGVLGELEEELATCIGRRRMRLLHALLLRVHDALEDATKRTGPVLEPNRS